MHKKKLIPILLLLSSVSANAQVDNYCLRLAPAATVHCGTMPEMNSLSEYTLQLWFNPDKWTEGATLMSVGEDIKLRLAKEGTVTAKLGAANIDITNAGLKTGKWTQLTIVVCEGKCNVLVNGKAAVEDDGEYALSANCGELTLGGNFEGRVDEVRLWATQLGSERDYYVHNTLNKWMPEIDKLLVYYKFDQNLCKDIVDYKTLLGTSSTQYNHHALMPSGASREIVTDNEGLAYKLCGAYLSNNRFYDRGVKAEQYLLANDIIMLSIKSFSDGHLEYATPNDHATLNNCNWLEEFDGRKGVVALDGNGSIVTTADAMKPVVNSYGKAYYTFETWLHLDEWTEGAYIVRKQTDDGKHGFSISLGGEATKQVIVTVNGNKFINTRSIPVGKWVHFAVTVYADGTVGKTFLFSYDGKGKFASDALSDSSTDYTPTGADDCVTVIGENLKGKLDETAMWSRAFGVEELKNHAANGMPMPAIGVVQTAEVIAAGQAYYTYDRKDNPGFDSYSQDHWLEMIRGVFNGYRGVKIRASVESHDGWQTTIANAERRKTFAKDLARLSEPYDGVELDLEWMDGKQTNLGLLADEIRAALPEGKTFMISCHAYGAYQFPTEKMTKVDGFTFQQYGPQKTWFNYDSFTSSARNFVNYGFPKDKIYLSFSTTTSQAYNDADQRVGAIAGYRGLMADGTLDPTDETLGGKAPLNGNYYYFMSPKQVYDRARYVVDNNLQGLFYWDMGNDISTEDPLSLVRHASYAMNSNVDKTVTSVEINHPTGIRAIDANQKQAISYDASSSIVKVQGACQTRKMSVYATDGMLVRETTASTLSIADLRPGVYVVEVRTTAPNGFLRKKIVKRNLPTK